MMLRVNMQLQREISKVTRHTGALRRGGGTRGAG